MNTLQALIMGLLQGLTEYLPVSSSGHLTIASELFGIDGESNMTFTIAVHVATVLSTLVILGSEIGKILKGMCNPLSLALSRATEPSSIVSTQTNATCSISLYR